MTQIWYFHSDIWRNDNPPRSHIRQKKYYSEPQGLTRPHSVLSQRSGLRLCYHVCFSVTPVLAGGSSLAHLRHMDRLKGGMAPPT